MIKSKADTVNWMIKTSLLKRILIAAGLTGVFVLCCIYYQQTVLKKTHSFEKLSDYFTATLEPLETSLPSAVPSLEDVSPVDINTADETLLKLLPGIGSSLAESILEYRDANDSFQSIEDLMNVPGIGEGKFSQVQPYITAVP